MHVDTRRAAYLDPAFNRLNYPTPFPEEMQRLKGLAAPLVERCITR
jgi:hypothetical protein